MIDYFGGVIFRSRDQSAVEKLVSGESAPAVGGPMAE